MHVRLLHGASALGNVELGDDQGGAPADRVVSSLDPSFDPRSHGALGRAGGVRVGRSAFTPDSPAVSAARVIIRGLDTEIGRLERENTTKRSAADAIILNIQQRQAQLEQAYEQKRRIGMVGALFGAPMIGVASLIMMQNDDQRLRTLNGDLARAQAELAEIDQSLETYRGRKTTVEAAIAQLEDAERAIGSQPSISARTRDPLARSIDEVYRSAELLANLETRIGLLAGLRDAAAAIGVRLDAVIGTLSEARDRAEAAMQASGGELQTLLRAALAEQPDEAARAWITRTLRGRIRSELERGIDALLEPRDLPAELQRLVRDRLVAILTA